MRFYGRAVLLSAWFMLWAAPSAFSQHSLSGKITYSGNGEPVAGAAVYLPDLRTGASTDTDGNYLINNLPAGTFTVQVSYVSHKTVLEKVMVSGQTRKDFQLLNASVSLEEVIVSGASVKTIVRESPIPITTLSKIQWLQSSSTNLVDAVAKLPGMSQISTGVGLSKPVIRGLGFNRVITMHDGIRQEDNQWGEEHSIHVDEYSIDRYEIIRGAGSLMYGSDGLGGVMSLLSPQPVEAGKVTGQFLYNYQSNNNLHGLSAMTAGNRNGLNWLLRLSKKNANNYRNTFDGRVFGSNFREDLDVNGMTGITRKWGYTRLYFANWQQQINIVDGLRNRQGQFMKAIARNDSVSALVTVPTGELSSRQINPDNSQDLHNLKISSNNLFFLGKSTLSANLGYSQNHRKEFGDVFTPGSPTLYFFLQTRFYDLRISLPEKNGLETTFGTNGMSQDLKNRGNEVLYPDFNLFDNGVFVFVKKSFPKLKMSGGARYDLRKLDIARLFVDAAGRFQTSPDGAVEERFKGLKKDFSNVTGSFGAVYEFTSKLSAKANLARGFRSPGVPEISSNGEHAGTFRYEIGNLSQQSETSLQSDLGMTYEGKNLYLDLSLFSNRIDHYTYSERVQTPDRRDSIIGGVPAYRYTQGNARLQGLEGQLVFNPSFARWFNFTQSYSRVTGRNLSAKNDSAQYLPFMPPPRWISRLRVSSDKISRFIRNAYVLAELEIHQAQDKFLQAYHTETATPGYTLLNAGIGADFMDKHKKTRFSVYVSAQNLTDLAYQNHQSRLKYLDINSATGRRGVFNMGRNLSVKLVIPFGN